MAVLAEEGRGTTLELAPAADPAPLGLAAFALTTFMLSGHNASFIPDILWVGTVTAGVAWYASAAGVINGMSPTPVLPVGRPLFEKLSPVTMQDAPMARERAA